MLCPKCNLEISEKIRFCAYCGVDWKRYLEENPEKAAAKRRTMKPQPIPRNDTVIPEVDDSEETFVEKRSDDKSYERVIVPENVKKPKRNKTVIIAAAVAGVLILVAVLVCLLNPSKPIAAQNTCGYYADGSYEVMTDLNKKETLKFETFGGITAENASLFFSPDGKYVFYYSAFSAETNTYSISRAEYGAPANKANNKIIKIDNVCEGSTFVGDNALLYKTGKNELYCLNETGVVLVDPNVREFHVSADRFIYIADKAGVAMLYGAKLSNPGESTLLASNIGDISNYSDYENIVFTRLEGNNSLNVYTVGFGKDERLLCEAANFLCSTASSAYFTVKNDTKRSYTDFIDDPDAQSEEALAAPVPESFVINDYRYTMLSGYMLKVEDYANTQLYTSCDKLLEWYKANGLAELSMQDALKPENAVPDGIKNATQSFVDRFAASADADGYIAVTDEVIIALKEIQKNSLSPSAEWQWLWLCFIKEQVGTKPDEEAYNAALVEWNRRSNLRLLLSQEENGLDTYTLFCVKDGKLKTWDTNVIAWECKDSVILYSNDKSIAKINFNEITDISYIDGKLKELSLSNDNWFLFAETDRLLRFSSDATVVLAEKLMGGSLYADEKTIYLSTAENTIMIAEIKTGVVGQFEVVATNCEILKIEDSVIYYEANTDGNYSLFSLSDNTQRALASLIKQGTATVYKDGEVFAYTPEGSLIQFSADGNQKNIASNVSEFSRADSSLLLYISDNTLYAYDGSESVALRKNVSALQSFNSLEQYAVVLCEY